jgi:hypothetical protein
MRPIALSVLAAVPCLLAATALGQPAAPAAPSASAASAPASTGAPTAETTATAAPGPVATAVAAPMPPPAPSASPAAATAQTKDGEKAADEATDHSRVVGRVGVGWFGMSNVPIATGTPGGTSDNPTVDLGAPATVPAPVLGIRYWVNELVGIDAGLGMSVATGSISTSVSAADKQTVLAFMYHLGIPIALYSGRHLSLQLTPEATFGHAHSSIEPALQPDPPPAATVTGFRLDVGARIGAELQWGFIGVPELSLEGSVGLYATFQGTDISVRDAHAAENDILISTAEYNSPWDVFTQHIRARYYF